MESKLKNLREHFELDVSQLEHKLDALETRVRHVELSHNKKQIDRFDPDITVVALRVPRADDENVNEVAERIVHDGLGLGTVYGRLGRLPFRPRDAVDVQAAWVDGRLGPPLPFSPLSFPPSFFLSFSFLSFFLPFFFFLSPFSGSFVFWEEMHLPSCLRCFWNCTVVY